MRIIGKVGGLLALIGALLLAGAAHALSAGDKCEAAKLKLASQYGACRLKAESKAVKKGGMPDYSKCDAKFGPKWASTESNGGGMCPSNGDQAAIQTFITQHADDVAAALAGGPLADCPGDLSTCNTELSTCLSKLPPLATGQTTAYGLGSDGDLQKGASRAFTDNGDGTITDNTTGLMWEKKSADGTIHDVDNLYTWCADVSPMNSVCDNGTNNMDGTVITTFLGMLNNVGGGFAGHTDWRIPNLNELESIRNAENVNPATYSAFNTGCAAICTVTTCSCTRSNPYWSSTTYKGSPNTVSAVFFSDGFPTGELKTNGASARAVRSDS